MATAAGVGWRGGGPDYPLEVVALMRYIGDSCWNDPGYDPARAQALFARVDSLTLAEVRAALTAIARSERFTAGAWQTALERGLLPALVERAAAVFDEAGGYDIEARKPPLTHPLVIVALRQALAWCVITAVPLGLGALVETARRFGVIASGNSPTPLYLLALICALGIVFNLVVGWRGRREIAAIRRGEHLAHWRYPQDAAVAAEAAADRRRKCLLLLFTPLIGLGLLGFLVGTIGAVAKGDAHLAWQGAGLGLVAGLALGLTLALPTWLLIGIRVDAARRLPAEVIFTASGFYRPGQFIPVGDWPRSSRRIRCLPAADGQPAQLEFKLRHIDLRVGLPHHVPGRLNAHFLLSVPPGREAEAAALAGHYREV